MIHRPSNVKSVNYLLQPVIRALDRNDDRFKQPARKCSAYEHSRPVPVASRSKEWICGRSLSGIAVLNPAWGMDVRVLCVVGQRSLCWTRKIVQRSLTECGVSECYSGYSKMKPRPTRAVEP